jgi:hypothetical protein
VKFPDWLKPAVPSLAWCVLVLGGIVLIEFGGPRMPEVPRAARTLPVNTWLFGGDLLRPEFSGRYIVAPGGVAKDKPVESQDVADQPVLPRPPPIRLLLSLPVSYRDIVTGINAGATVRLCGKPPLALGAVTVTFVRCAVSGVTDCSAVIEVPPGTAADLAGKGLNNGTWNSELHLAPTCQ